MALLTDSSFPESATSEQLARFYTEIGLSSRTIQALKALDIQGLSKNAALSSLRTFVPALLDPDNAEYAADTLIHEAGKLGMGSGILVLRIQLEAALLAWEQHYVPVGIPRSIFIATMRHFSLFMEEREAGFHDTDFDRGWWSWRFTAGLEFRVGTLFYEMTNFPGATSPSPALAIHIPSDAQLDNTATHASFRKAHAFFAQFFPDFHYASAFTDSWLLAPVLEKILGQKSRIREFRNNFHLLSADENSDAALQFIFQNPKIQPADMPENTSLQRSIKKLYLEGNHAGVGLGRLEHNGKILSWNTNPFAVKISPTAALQTSEMTDMKTQPHIESSETVYAGAIFHVDDVDVRLRSQNGEATHIQRQVVRHQPAVVLLVHDCANDAYLLEREYRVGSNSYAFGLPAGLVDAGDGAETAAFRELREETGVSVGADNAQDVTVDTVGSFYSSEGMTDEVVTVMVIHLRRWEHAARHFDADEHVQSAWVSWDELNSAGIRSSNSIIALQYEQLRRAGLSHE